MKPDILAFEHTTDAIFSWFYSQTNTPIPKHSKVYLYIQNPIAPVTLLYSKYIASQRTMLLQHVKNLKIPYLVMTRKQTVADIFINISAKLDIPTKKTTLYVSWTRKEDHPCTNEIRSFLKTSKRGVVLTHNMRTSMVFVPLLTNALFLKTCAHILACKAIHDNTNE